MNQLASFNLKVRQISLKLIIIQ